MSVTANVKMSAAGMEYKTPSSPKNIGKIRAARVAAKPTSASHNSRRVNKPFTRESAASVTNHNRNGKRNHRQRENDRVRSIAERTQIRRVGDKHLVGDVV